jgi:hypothetical protein
MRACWLMLALALAGCASRDLWPVERVDPETAIHVTVMAEPWIYALGDIREAANATRFLNVAVVEANQTGTRRYWLNLVFWSTSARGKDPGAYRSLGPVKVTLAWPTKQLQLASAAEGRAAAGISEPAFSVPGARLGEAWCPLSAEQVAEIGAGAPTAISLVDENGQVRSYVSWQTDDAAIKEFLKATGRAQ